jgi:hypothetical protein
MLAMVVRVRVGSMPVAVERVEAAGKWAMFPKLYTGMWIEPILTCFLGSNWLR